MTVRQMIDEMQLTPLTCPDPERVVTGGYVGDLLSWVMGRARSGQAWITWAPLPSSPFARCWAFCRCCR